MPTVKITRADGQTFEISDVSIAEIKYLISTNGQNGHSAPPLVGAMKDMALATKQNARPSKDYPNFKASLTDKARQFFHILHENPNGITSEHLATKLGFQSGAQLGGMAGGGIGKMAAKFGIDVSDLYVAKAEFGPNGRVVTYLPGPYMDYIL